MSRTLDAGMTSAINKISGIKSAARVTVFNNRNYFDAFDSTSGSYQHANAAGITDTPLPQVHEYYTSGSTLYSLYTNPNTNILTLSKVGSSNKVQIYKAGSPLVAPAWGKSGMALPYIYYLDNSDHKIKKATLNMSTLTSSWTSGSLNCVTTLETITDALTTGSVLALCAISETEFVRLFIDDGGIGVIHYEYNSGTSTWDEHIYDHRFMIPDQILDADEANGYFLNFSAAVKNTDIYVYLSMPAGEVKGICMEHDRNVWSDIFTAIPSDLSTFRIANAFVHNEKIHLSGQFQRVDDEDAFSSTSVWNLLAGSEDGRTFSIDRFTLFSLMGYRFSAIMAGNNIYYIDANRYAMFSAPYAVVGESADNTVIRNAITELSGGSDSGYSVSISDPKELYLNHALLQEGNIAKLEIGVNTSGSNMSFVTWDTCVVDSIKTVLADALRSFELLLVSEGFYRVQQFTYPFYMEMQGKQSEFDPIQDLGNMYKAAAQPGIDVTFCTDFWGNDEEFRGNGLPPMYHDAATTKAIMSTDLKEYLGLVDYPVITELPITLKIYGWSRIGVYGTAPKPWTDDTLYTKDNDNFVGLIKVRHEDETEETLEVTLASAVDKSYPPQTWKPGNARINGSYPVEYTTGSAIGLEIGDKILEVGVRLQSPDDAPTVFGLERIEIPEVVMYIDCGAFSYNTDSVTELETYDPVNDYESWTFSSGWGNWGEQDDSGLTPTVATGPSEAMSSDLVMFEATSGSAAKSGAIETTITPVYFGARKNMIFSFSFGAYTYSVADEADQHIDVTIQTTSGSYFVTKGIYAITSKSAEYPSYRTGTFSYQIPDTVNGENITSIRISVFTHGGSTANSGITDAYIDNIKLGLMETHFGPAQKDGLLIANTGIPTIYFSSNPYNAFNFETSCKIDLDTNYAYGGVIGLAESGRNFICARYKGSMLSLIKVRDGTVTELATQYYANTQTFIRLMLKHKDGDLYVYVQEDLRWGTPKITYRWQHSDGPIATDSDLLHTGIYAYINVPRFRICSFDPGESKFVAVLPGYDSATLGIGDLPTSGSITIDGLNYKYTGKITSGSTLRGPFQVRNIKKESRYANGGTHRYANQKQDPYCPVGMEFTNFEWLPNATMYAKYRGMLMASSAGYTWKIWDTDFRPWITTLQETVYLMNRARFFGEDMNANTVVSLYDKVWITDGLTGVRLLPEQSGSSHMEGAFCHKYSSAQAKFTDFYSSSGDSDCSVKDLIDKICRMTGAKALFPGDVTYATLALEEDTKETI